MSVEGVTDVVSVVVLVSVAEAAGVVVVVDDESPGAGAPPPPPPPPSPPPPPTETDGVSVALGDDSVVVTDSVFGVSVCVGNALGVCTIVLAVIVGEVVGDLDVSVDDVAGPP